MGKGFDCYYVEAVSTSIRALRKIYGVDDDNIKPIVRYGGKFPHQVYGVRLKEYDVYDMGDKAAKAACDEFRNGLPRIDKVEYIVRRYIMD